jgi:hypothetical protein
MEETAPAPRAPLARGGLPDLALSPGATGDHRAAQPSWAEGVSGCATLLEAAGPARALAFLNARTRYRYTGLYRAAPPLLCNLCLYDRENPGLNCSGEVSLLDETYCAIVCAHAEPYSVNDGRGTAAERAALAAGRQAVLSYCGVPIRSSSGTVLGTLCHFDVRPRLLPRDECDLLEAVAPLFLACLAGAR